MFRVKLSETSSRHLDEGRSPSLDLAEDKVLRRARVSSACHVWREHKQQPTAASTLCNVKSSDRMYSPGWLNPLGRKFSCEATKSHTASSIGRTPEGRGGTSRMLDSINSAWKHRGWKTKHKHRKRSFELLPSKGPIKAIQTSHLSVDSRDDQRQTNNDDLSPFDVGTKSQHDSNSNSN